MAHRHGRTMWMLALACGYCFAITLLRVFITGHEYYFFLNWNLFLALVPLGFAIAINRSPSVLLLLLLLPLWLVFYPNASYLITDFTHLKMRQNIPVVFDAVIILSFTIVGLTAGAVSLHLVQEKIKKLTSSFVAWVLVIVVLVLSSWGVYIGRFARWNSWEVFTAPQAIVMDMFGTVTNPILYTRVSLAFVLLFSSFSILGYLIFLSLIHTHHSD